MSRLPPLSALRAFEATARLLSFTRAASELHVTQSAVSRQVRALENWLHAPLFHRRTRAIVLTEAGAEYYLTVSQSFAVLEQATTTARKRTARGVLNLSCLPTLATKWLMPRLVRFTEAHPRIEVRLMTSIAPANFDEDGLDLAIRVGQLRSSTKAPDRPKIDLVMTNRAVGLRHDYLFPDTLVPVASPALLRGGAPLVTLDDLIGYTLIHNASRPNAWRDWVSYQAHDAIRPMNELWFGHFFMAIQASVEGRGIALIPRVLVESELSSGLLVVPLDLPVDSAGSYYLLSRSSDSKRAEIQSFRRWLLTEAAAGRTRRV